MANPGVDPWSIQLPYRYPDFSLQVYDFDLSDPVFHNDGRDLGNSDLIRVPDHVFLSHITECYNLRARVIIYSGKSLAQVLTLTSGQELILERWRSLHQFYRTSSRVRLVCQSSPEWYWHRFDRRWTPDWPTVFDNGIVLCACSLHDAWNPWWVQLRVVYSSKRTLTGVWEKRQREREQLAKRSMHRFQVFGSYVEDRKTMLSSLVFHHLDASVPGRRLDIKN